MRKILLGSGIAAALVYIAADTLGAASYPGYHYLDQTISELSAIGAPSRPFMVSMFWIHAFLTLCFAIGVWLTAASRRVLHVAACVIALYSFAAIPFAPMHTREVLAAGGATWTDTMHIVMTIVDATLLGALIVLGAIGSDRTFRVYSLVTLVVFLGCGALSARYGAAIQANEPTPWVGVVERITVLGSMVWIAMFAARLLRTSHRTTHWLRPGTAVRAAALAHRR